MNHPRGALPSLLMLILLALMMLAMLPIGICLMLGFTLVDCAARKLKPKGVR